MPVITRAVFLSAMACLALVGAGSSLFASAGDEPRKSKAPAAKAIGEPQNCIPLRRVLETKAHDDYTIDFEMRGGRVYRNTLRNRCSGLAFEGSFGYSTSLNQLCSADAITVLSQGGPGLQPRASCGLGQFQEIEIIEESDNADE